MALVLASWLQHLATPFESTVEMYLWYSNKTVILTGVSDPICTEDSEGINEEHLKDTVDAPKQESEAPKQPEKKCQKTCKFILSRVSVSDY